MRENIEHIIEAIQPFDEIEAAHRDDALRWIQSGEEIFRLEKPAVPPKHLVSYGVLTDHAQHAIMLVDHKKAKLWLPPGGHVEKDEDPAMTVVREIREELDIVVDFVHDQPLFITQAVTVGLTKGHTDVSLWYVLNADSQRELVYDTEEFDGYQWLGYEEILNRDSSLFDPHMQRFVRKLLATLAD